MYRLIGLGKFPKEVKLSERASAWIESEVEAFMTARTGDRDERPRAAAPPLVTILANERSNKAYRLKLVKDLRTYQARSFSQVGEPSKNRFRLAEFRH